MDIGIIKSKLIRKRILANGIDWIVIGIISMWVIILLTAILNISIYPQRIHLEFNKITGIFLLIGILYYSFLDGYMWDSTIGKRIFSLKTVFLNKNSFDFEDRKLTFSESLLRTCYKYVSFGICGIGLIMALFDKKGQTLHDKLGKSIVINNNNELIFKDISQENFSSKSLFLKRLFAVFIDCNLIFVIAIMFAFLFFILVPNQINSYYMAMWYIVLAMLFLFISLCIMAGFESSKFQATPGKLLMNIFIVNEQNGKISFFRAFIRNICKCLCFNFIFSIINFILICFSKDNQSIHDLLVKTKVVSKK